MITRCQFNDPLFVKKNNCQMVITDDTKEAGSIRIELCGPKGYGDEKIIVVDAKDMLQAVLNCAPFLQGDDLHG